LSEPSHIVVRNARAHNLQGVDVDVPRHAMTTFTGVSGSGKSSLVYDTIYQEGQRRFVESLSSYARQFLGQMERPDVDMVEGVSPTVSIDQKTVNRNPRSTVGTITEIYDHLRLLLARLGTPHCPHCDKVIERLGVDDIVDAVLARAEGQRVQVLAPVVRARKGEYRKEFEEWARDGWVRARVDGQDVRLEEPPELERLKKHTIELVVDRLRARTSDRDRLAEGIETALGLAERVVVVRFEDGDQTFSADRSCPDHPEVAVPELEPRVFSFNAPQGACEHCNGLGELVEFDPDLIVDLSQKLPGAYLALNKDGKVPFGRLDAESVVAFAKRIGPVDKPLEAWPPHALDTLLFGDMTMTWVSTRVKKNGALDTREYGWRGLVPTLAYLWQWTKFTPWEKFRSRVTCPSCRGARVNAVARAVRFRGKAIHEMSHLTVHEARFWLDRIRLKAGEKAVGAPIVSELRDRLRFLDDVGLHYLGLDRSAATLSGGESQRIRLARQVGSGLQGVTYVLDEPSIGLHPRDNGRLIRAMHRLRDRGNTVLVVEHDPDTVLASDYVVDIGPGAGIEGGELTGKGTPGRFIKGNTLTARWLRGLEHIPTPEERREAQGQIAVRGAKVNNLKDLSVSFPLGVFGVLTGVSGSGKSSLLFSVLEPGVRAALAGEHSPHAIDGLDQVDKMVRISQRPIGRSSRSNPVTYTKAFDIIRDLFASVPEARARGYKKGRFSFNVKGGRCEECLGHGYRKVEMQFLPDVEVPCEACGTRRFNPDTLEIRWKGLNIADVLALNVSQALELFKSVPKLRRILETMERVGLGYLPIGQPSTTLSGGEAQRIKLATELHRPSTGRTLYLLDEPTTGLHMDDVRKLVGALQELVSAGNSVWIVEHNLDLIRCADWIVDLGPEGGEGGGTVVGQGTPEAISKLGTPTGLALAQAFAPPVAEAKRGRYRTQRADSLAIRGASLHNLAGVDVDIPHGKMTVVTGVSGSGKSSLAFDTIFAEGQRRYVESLSTYARRFLGRVQRAPVESIQGLQPAIAVNQVNARHNPRSTVGTVTEVYDVLRVLWARLGTPHCTSCGRAVRAESASVAARRLKTLDGQGWIVAALPTDDPAATLGALQGRGYARVLRSLADPSEIALEQAEAAISDGALLVLDRVRPSKTATPRLTEALEQAYEIGGGQAWFVPRKGGEPQVFTASATCPDHGPVFAEELTPRHFSFNARLGACPSCDGVGHVRQMDVRALCPDHSKTLEEGLAKGVLGRIRGAPRNAALLESLLGAWVDRPVASWPGDLWDRFVHGSSEALEIEWGMTWGSGRRVVKELRPWPGVVSLSTKWNFDGPFHDGPCPDCHGARLGPAVRAVRFQGLAIHELMAQTVDQAGQIVSGWSLQGSEAVIGERAVTELSRRLAFLRDVGLGYLGLDRAANSLSGGESQRIRLATQLGSGLTGVTYVLDEPTIGLHPRDTDRLLGTLEGLRTLGNTLVVVEHDLATIERADHVVDMGPGAGRFGGQVLASAAPGKLGSLERSVTGRWLSGDEQMPSVGPRRAARDWIHLRGAHANNLKHVDLKIGVGQWTSIAGVSGSGKSSLIRDGLAPALRGDDGPWSEFSSPELQLVWIGQAPATKSPRSTPATMVKAMDPIRSLFASTPAARARGWKPGRFSFNAAAARCPQCEGRGAELVEMHFLPDVWVTCSLCDGKRYARDTLTVRYHGKTVADVLAMRADEALEFFTNHRRIKRHVQALVDVGLGYLALGQAANTLSGGELQRVKLASELVSRRKPAIYILDEPTTGLHLADIRQLISVLQRLVDQGHTVVTIEHHESIWLQSDRIVELGPEGGELGGRVVAEGTPEQMLVVDTPTGRALSRAVR